MNDIVFHYTCTHHLPFILSDGYLKLTESNLSFKKPMQKPVVWFTDSEIPDGNGLCKGGDTVGNFRFIADKTELRLHVIKGSNFEKWVSWSIRNRMNERDRKMLIATAGANSQYNSWWVSEEAVSIENIVRIENTITGEVLAKSPGGVAYLQMKYR